MQGEEEMKTTVIDSYTNDKKLSKKWVYFNWFIFGLILIAGVGYATTVSENGLFANNGVVNVSNLNYGNISGTYQETIAGREFTTNYQRILRVGTDKEFQTIQSAINQVPFMLRHNYTIIIDDGTYAEDLYFPSMIIQRRHPTEGSVVGLELKGNTSNINGVKIKSIQASGIIGAIGLAFDYMQIYGQDPTSDELVSVSVYGSNSILMHHINFTNASANYAVMAYSSNLAIHTSSFELMDYAGLAKVQSNLRLGDNYQGSWNNGTLNTAIAKSDDASFVFIEGTTNLVAPMRADGSGITTYGNNERPNLFLNNGTITMSNATGATIISPTNVTTNIIQFIASQLQGFIVAGSNPAIYSTGQSGGTYPFTEVGNLVIQPRRTTQDRDIIFAVGDGVPDIPMIIDGGTAKVIFGNGTGHQNFSMVSPNLTKYNCGVNNSGFFSCS